MCNFYYNKMQIYTERQVIMISKIQADSLAKLRNYNVYVSQFIRQAIKEKINREWKQIKEEKENIKIPF